MRPLLHTAAVFLFLLGFSAVAQQVNFRNYSVGDGLAQSQVFAMAEDREGYIWMGTRGGGISRFDGIRFTNFTTRDGLLNDFISCLFTDSKGNICIGTNIGLSVYNGKDFNNYPLRKDSATLSISAIAEDRQGNLWLATGKGLYIKRGEKVECYSCRHQLDREIISCLFFDSAGKLWYGDDFGLNRVDTVNGKVQLAVFRRKEGFSNVLIRNIREIAKGKLLVGTYGGGVFLFSNGKAYSSAWNESMQSKIVHDVLQDKKGNYWIGTYDAGVYRVRATDSLITHYGTSEGLANDHVSVLFEDSWGNIWVGTSGGGVSRFSGEQFMHYTEKNGLPGNYVFAISVESDSVLWMGTSVKGVVRMNTESGTSVLFGADSGFVNEKVKAIYRDSSGVMWFGTEGKGLWKKDSSGFHQFTVHDGLSSNWIKSILSDTNGKLWMATAGGGISVMTNDEVPEFKKINEKNGLARNRVNCLHLDHQGRIWYGTEGGGLGLITNEKIRNFTTSDGLSSNVVRALREDANGYLWVATGGGGLSRVDIYRGFHIDRLDRNKGLTSDNLYLLEIDQQNNLWAGSESGVDRIILNENSEFTEIKHFGKAEGFQGIETCQNSVAIAPDGSLWFGTINGLTRYNPDRNEKNTIAPRLRFTGINLFYQPLTKTRFSHHYTSWGIYTDQPVFTYEENHIGFEFIGIDHRNPTSVKYQWKLEGADEDWSPLSLKREVTYSNLLPGEYVFRVRAVNEDGISSQDDLSYRFSIDSPFWQRWWFKLMLFAGAALLIVGLILIITRRIRNKNKALREMLRVEKRMVELEQKALRLQMNPHFIFHALNSIQGLITQKDEQTARLYLAKFSKLMRAILENSREQLIPLDKEMETLRDYLSLEKFTRNDAFDFSIHADEEVNTEEVLIPSMLLQPFVENSIIHGFSGLQRRGKIEITFRMHGKFLECRVRDNGIGREKAQLHKAQLDTRHKSMALIVTQERLALINRQSGEQSGSGSIEIRDLTDENKLSCGTEVLIRILVEE